MVASRRVVSKFRKPKAYRKVRHENGEVREEKSELGHRLF
jgi:hypothetical protein